MKTTCEIKGVTIFNNLRALIVMCEFFRDKSKKKKFYVSNFHFEHIWQRNIARPKQAGREFVEAIIIAKAARYFGNGQVGKKQNNPCFKKVKSFLGIALLKV